MIDFYGNGRPTPLSDLLRIYFAKGGGGSSVLKTVTGTLLHILDALAKPAVSFEVGIEPQQDLHGQANPYPAGGGKNKFDKAYYSDVSNYSTLYSSYYYSKLLLKPNTSYVFNPTSTSALSTSRYYVLRVISGSDADDPTDSEVKYPVSAGTPVQIKFTTGETGAIWFGIFSGETASLSVFMSVDWQLEEGSTATAWSPYENICPITGWAGANVYRSGADTSNPTTIPITFPDAAGTVYGGTLTLEDGVWKLTVTHKYYTNAGTENWGATTSGGARYYIAGISYDAKDASKNGWSNIGNLVSTFYGDGIEVGSNGRINLCGNLYSSFASIDDLKTYLALNPLQVVYELATPVTYTLTGQQALQLLKGENNIWSSIPNGELSLTYKAQA